MHWSSWRCSSHNSAGNGTRRQIGENERKMELMRFFLGILAYLVPTFALGFVWHLMLFEDYYKALAIYRSDIIIPFGFLSMLIQAVLFAWIYQRAFARGDGGLLGRALRYAAFGAVLSWSFTTLAVAAKNVMTSVPNYLVIETAFTVVQWMMVGPLTALTFGQPLRAADQVLATTVEG